jgi:hypothetical protein
MKKHADAEKLRILLPHWIEHNYEHAAEFREWAARVRFVNKDLLIAANFLEKASHALEACLEKQGGLIEKHQES